MLNTIVAESIDRLSNEVESRGVEALPEILKESWNANKQVVFNGDNYSEEWHAEAEQRGLLNLRTTPDALPDAGRRAEPGDVRAVRGPQRPRDRRPLRGLPEQYTAKVNIEAETAATIARTQLLPAAVKHLARCARRARAAGSTP